MGDAPPFVVDPEAQQIAEAYALDAQDFSRSALGIELAWEESSAKKVEEVLARLHDDLPHAGLPDSSVESYAKGFGSFLGELLRKLDGGEWGYATIDGTSMAALRLSDQSIVFPWARAYRRIKDGPEDNVAHYFATLRPAP